MSYTEIFTFNKEGYPSLYGRIQNHYMGAKPIWRAMESKYLHGTEVQTDDSKDHQFYRGGKGKELAEMLDLISSPKTTREDQIILLTTFGDALVRIEHLPEVIAAYLSFEGDTNLKRHGKKLRGILEMKDVIAVGWNQTTLYKRSWLKYYYDIKRGEYLPYNCLKGESHSWVFDYVKSREESNGLQTVLQDTA